MLTHSAIMRMLISAMGGDVRAESTPGEGSVFTLRAPMAQPAFAAQGGLRR